MQLPDESVTFQYQSLLTPLAEEWTPAAELRSQHFLASGRLKELTPRLLQVRSQIASERDLLVVPGEGQLVEAGFIDLPLKTLEEHRRQGASSSLGQVLQTAQRLRSQVDRIVVLGAGGAHRASRALIEAIKPTYHNELPAEARLGSPRVYFEGYSFDNDGLQELFELLQTTCVDPELNGERWGVLAIDQPGDTLETAAAYRAFRREAAEFYGSRSQRLQELFVPITGMSGKFRELCKAQGFSNDAILTAPDRIGGRFSAFTAVGLLPAAVLGLDVQAVLLGAAAMTRRFLEEPFERNPVLQFAAVNHLITEQLNKPIRVLAVWSRKLEALGAWYEQLLCECLGKQGKGPTPLTIVATRDLHARAQHLHEGPRDKVIHNLVIGAPKTLPLTVGMAEHNQDELNPLCRKTWPMLAEAARYGGNQICTAAARPAADLMLPSLSEHTIGQLMQLLMLATVVEGRLSGINPYGRQGAENFQRSMKLMLNT